MTAFSTTTSDAGPDRKGLAAGLLCYSLWGLLPLLFNAAEHAGAGDLEIVAWRTLWAAPLAFILVWTVDRGAALKVLLARPKDLLMLVLSATLIAINWITYVWAVDNGHTLAASLGYYLTPLINMAAGALMFRERIDRVSVIAMGLAVLGVAVQGLALGKLPWIPLVLAVSFGGYGIVRKRAAADAQTGLLVECLVLLVPAAAYAAWTTAHGHGAFGRTVPATLLLLLCGPATVVPLALFAFAARRLPLTMIGFFQFIAPTLQFLYGLAVGERLTPVAVVSFLLIWTGVAVFVGGAVWRSRRQSQLRQT